MLPLKKLIATLLIAAAELAKHEAEGAKKDKVQGDHVKDGNGDEDNEKKEGKDDESQLQCDPCNQSFANRGALRKHMREIHEGVEPWPCKDPNCDYTNRDKGRLNHHMNQKHAATTSPYPKALKRSALASYFKAKKLA